jgi:hypothetical protein
MLRQNPDDCARSERATYLCLTDWLAHSPDPQQQARAAEMRPAAESMVAQMPETERAALNEKKLAEIRARMDELSRRWSALRVDESIALEWSISP